MAEPLSDETGDSEVAAPQTGISRWAIFALGTSLAFFCPLLTIIGPMLGLRALVQIRAHPQMAGRSMALVAIWIGAIGCIGWIALLIWWNVNVRGELLRGPETAIQLGMAGDYPAMRDRFVGDGTVATDDRIKAFVEPLRDRYGVFQSASQDDSAAAPTQEGGRSVVIPYVLHFDRGPVTAETRILLFARMLAPRLESITVRDGVRGDLTFP